MGLTTGEKLFLGALAAVGTALVAFVQTARREHGDGDEGEPPIFDPARLPVQKAWEHLELWGGRAETDPGVRALLDGYWASIGWAPQEPDVPWSAAFISAMAQAISREALRPSPSHIDYARAAYQARQSGTRDRFWAYRPEEIAKLLPGDVLVRTRGEPVTWADVEQPPGAGFKKSHGDLVVSVAPSEAGTIGGNVDQSVRVRAYELEGSRLLSAYGSDRVFAVLRYRAGTGGVPQA